MKKLFTVFSLSFLVLAGCKKEGVNHRCYDSAIVHDNGCPQNCPGITGCDGKFYCNECEAARHGIRKK